MNYSRNQEITEEKLTSWADNGKACIGCMFAYGDTLLDNAPNKCSCAIYRYPRVKPDNVYLDGGFCKYRREKIGI